MNNSITDKFEKKLANEVDGTYTTNINIPKRLTESEMDNNLLTKIFDVPYIKIKRAYCPDCKEELISKFPPMFNPFTQEKQCIHKCDKCKTTYNLDYAYPRIMYLDEQNNEIFAHCE